MNDIVNEKIFRSGKSIYRISKDTGIPYTTLNQIANEKVDIRRCLAGTVCRLAQYLGCTAEDLLRQTGEFAGNSVSARKKITDEPLLWVRGWLQHKVKSSELDTIVFLISTDTIPKFMAAKKNVCGLYALSLLDTLCNKNDLPICSDFDMFRHYRLKEPYYVCGDVLSEEQKKQFEYLPEFAKHNIYEVTIYGVV